MTYEDLFPEKRRPTPAEERAWAEECARRKEAEAKAELTQAESDLEAEIGFDAFYALRRYLDLRDKQ